MLLTLLTLYIVNSFFHTLAIVEKSDIGKGRRRKQRDKDGHSAQTVISCVHTLAWFIQQTNLCITAII